MLTSSVRARSCLGVAALCGVAAAAPAAPPAVHLDQSLGESRLSLVGGPVFRTTTDQVLSPRVVDLPGDPALVLWEERNAAGTRQAYYGVAMDGRRVFLATETGNSVRLRYHAFDPLAGQPGVPEGLASPASSRVRIVQYVAPPLDSMRDAVRAAGGRVLTSLTDHCDIVWLPAGGDAQVAALPFVRWTGPFHTAYKLDPAVLAEVAAGADGGAPTRYTLFLMERGPGPQDTVRARVLALGGTINQMFPEGFLVEATLSPQAMLQIARMDEVLSVEPWGPPAASMNIARDIGGANVLENATGFNGQGVRAEVYDTGLRTTHIAFQNPPPILHGPNYVDTFHGTACYGIVFGNGTVVPNGRGLLPGREQGIFGSAWLPIDRYVHTAELYNPALQYRAVFQTNSWVTTPITTQYNSVAATLDDIVFVSENATRPSFLILHSHGNYGSQQAGRQGWAKNIISVGGIEHKDTILRADDEWIGGASIGPASDGRVKPDLSHFYDKVLTTSDLTNTSYWPDMGGTSAACPITAGHAGLLFQMWHEGYFPGFGGGSTVFSDRPASTTVKALLVNTAYQYPFTSPSANLSRGVQGWGTADLGAFMANQGGFFIVNEGSVLTPASSKSYSLEVKPDTPQLRVTMAFLDPKGNPAAQQARINDLSLRVTSPTGTVYWGNSGMMNGNWTTPGGTGNQVDNVENVFVLNPAAGVWLVEVLAVQILADGNPATPATDADFALVAHPVELVQPVSITLTSGAPTLVAPAVATEVFLDIEPGTQNPVPSTARLHYRPGSTGAFTQITLQSLGGPSYRALLPAASCNQTPQFYFSCQGDGGATAFDPVNAPASFYTAQVGAIQTLYEDNFEGDAQWAVQNTTVQAGAWERGVPEGNGVEGDPPVDFDGSGKCWTTGIGPFVDVDGGPTTLTSTGFNLTGQAEARLTYARWAYTTDPQSFDDLKIQVSNNNGATWEDIETIGEPSPGWVLRTIRVADYATPTAQVRLRFSIEDNPANSTTEGGVDALKFTALTCTMPCYPDCNGSGNLTVADFACYQASFVAGQPYADCNASGTLTIADFACFQSKFVAGCP